MFESMEFWWWFVAAGALAVVEVILPTFFFLWLSVACCLSGIVLSLVPSVVVWQQLVLFSLFAVVSIFVGRFFKSKKSLQQASLNNRMDGYVGRVVALTKDVENGFGEVRFDDMPWKAHTIHDGLKKGDRVQVVGISGMSFEIQPVPDKDLN